MCRLESEVSSYSPCINLRSMPMLPTGGSAGKSQMCPYVAMALNRPGNISSIFLVLFGDSTISKAGPVWSDVDMRG